MFGRFCGVWGVGWGREGSNFGRGSFFIFWGFLVDCGGYILGLVCLRGYIF